MGVAASAPAPVAFNQANITFRESPLPCGPVAAAVCRGANEPCFYDTTCEHGLLGCDAGGVGMRCRFCGFGDYDSVLCPTDTSTVHGDALLMAGTQRKFTMPLATPVPMLAWRVNRNETLQLNATAFETPSTHDQWFDSFSLSSNGREIFNVSCGFSKLGTVKLSIDGKPRPAASNPDRKYGAVVKFTSVSSPTAFELSMLPDRLRIGNKRAQKLTVRTRDGVAFSVFSSKAAKFEDQTMQVKYAHLNLRLDTGLPESATGSIAEMAGDATMSAHTKRMLRMDERAERPKDASKSSLASLKLVQLQSASALLP
jgi:hypothetical protein